MTTSNHRPGDIILSRYMPDTSDVKREEARANLYGFVAVLIRIAKRCTAEEITQAIRAKAEGTVESEV